jgi:hypothetical protein
MDKVAYIIGAGFSAPLGIPTMGNFLFKSKDLYFSDVEKYKHFEQVFDAINKLSITKNYYDSDLFNIEEILSVIEMNQFLDGSKLDVDFIDYIKDVIRHYTPLYENIGDTLPGNWEDWLFGKSQTLSLYGYFVSSLMGLRYERKESNKIVTGRTYDFTATNEDLEKTKYSVISLNYDLVLENVAEAISNQYLSKESIQFKKDGHDSTWSSTHLAKLHGCLNSSEIVPPTWAKGTHESIIPIWKNAFRLLGEANHIRFVGYSLPVADSYIKYLLKASVIDAPHLKSIDVICLDSDGSTKSRYDNFFEFNNYRFVNGSVIDYFKSLKGYIDSGNNRRQGFVDTAYLERAHESFISNA